MTTSRTRQTRVQGFAMTVFDVVYCEGAPSCNCQAFVQRLRYSDMCIDCVEREIGEYHARSSLNPDKNPKTFQCHRCLREGEASVLARRLKYRRPQKAFGVDLDSWQWTPEPNWCEKCQGVTDHHGVSGPWRYNGHSNAFWRGCREPLKCNYSWHSLYRKICEDWGPIPQ